MTYYVYIMASARNGTLYTGVTNDVAKRAGQHKDAQVPGFTRRYGVKCLVWYETHDDINTAIAREKQIKGLEPGLENSTDRERQSRLE